jgi:signal transduction histidine kinase
MPRLFEAFQPGVKENGPTAGLGLGLYIVEQIVEAQGGSIEVRSKDGDGTVFTVRLPRRARAA